MLTNDFTLTYTSSTGVLIYHFEFGYLLKYRGVPSKLNFFSHVESLLLNILKIKWILPYW